MLGDWRTNWSGKYLEELYRLHAPPQLGAGCSCGGLGVPDITCSDCLTSRPVCADCMVKRHEHIPAHRPQQWINGRWKRIDLASLGHVLVLGQHNRPCSLGNTRSFTLGALTGLHEIQICYCGCPSEVEPALQLLRSHIFPCSETLPSSGFTFSLLRQFHFAATDAKVPAQAFYNVLVRQTNNTRPEQSGRYRELLRTTRAWMFLSDQKRAGVTKHTIHERNDVSLPCPACPRLNVNYTMSDVIESQE
jgi:hypothetical protein